VDVSQADGYVEINQITPTSYPAIYSFSDNESIRLKAIPPPGYYFTNWSGDLGNTDNPVTIVMECNMNITANFSPILHILTIHINGNGSSSPEGGKHSYTEGTVVILSAIPDDGWQFDSWTGDITKFDKSTILLTMDSQKTIAANFSKVKPNWWLITGIITGFLAIGMIIWLLVKKRTTLHHLILKYHKK
jgi:uncharacterized repeat protein (TIGR02543 family)